MEKMANERCGESPTRGEGRRWADGERDSGKSTVIRDERARERKSGDPK